MGFIKVSEGASLALHAMVLIARNRPERMKVRDLADRLNGSRAHMAKIFQKLASAGLVNSTRGPSGGFELNIDPEDVTFLDILKVIDGEANPEGCPLGREVCMFDECIFRDEVQRISADIHDMYGKIKLSDFIS